MTLQNEIMWDLVESHTGLSRKSEEGLVLYAGQTDNQKMLSEVSYVVPIKMEAVVKTDSTNIRLYFAQKGRLIFNWDSNQDEVRLHSPIKGYTAVNFERLSVNEWAKITWIVNPDHMIVRANDKEVCKVTGAFRDLTGRVGIGPAWGSQLVVKSFRVNGEYRKARKLTQKVASYDEQIITEFITLRNQTLSLMDRIPENISDIIPEGFDSNIHYHFGFILVAWDHGIFPKLKQNYRVPIKYHRMFPIRLKPKDWKEDPPGMLEIRKHLEKQRDEIATISSGQLDVLIKHKQTLRRLLKYFMPLERSHCLMINDIMNSISNGVDKG
ncbi:hypothetical protein PV433_16430 [Paenibacillus sp. GYB004]|uniref:hypothetical protein n=1 Tax=Paenibacillus sp. GYB004 TaxID=2994393 RepID=UPI002F96B26B